MHHQSAQTLQEGHYSGLKLDFGEGMAVVRTWTQRLAVPIAPSD